MLRLKKASPGELLYRFRQAVMMFYVKKREQSLFRHIPTINSKDLESIVLPELYSSIEDELSVRILEGSTFFLSDEKSLYAAYEMGNSAVFCNDVVAEGTGFDIRSVWEPARLQHLLILLLYNRHQQDKAIDEFIKRQVLTWIGSNPFPCGPHYISAMECGMRIPVFLHILKHLRNLENEDFQRIAEAIYIHAWWISHRLSLYSSLGNHTVAECTGLVFAGIVFRNTTPGKRWLKTGTALLKQEAGHQILPDGGPAEQSINYHRFVLDLYWYCLDFLEKNTDLDFSDIKPRLTAGEFFLKSMQTGQADLPSIGDSDDGHAVAPGAVPRRFQPENTTAGHQTFPESGYSIFNTPNGSRMIFDHGPLGMAPLYNHGHADALSIILHKDGLPFLVDPGTYRYNGTTEYRRYFKSTRAHNTVTIDNSDQAVQETGFVWSHPYSSRMIRTADNEQGFLIEAMHDGYSRLEKKVYHHRTILNVDDLFIIRDKFEGIGQHEFELNYHLHPDAPVEYDGQWWRIKQGQTVVFLRLLKGDVLTSYYGQEDPVLGWFSPSYGIKEKSRVLQCRKTDEASRTEFHTAICTGDVLERSELEAIACRM